MKRFVATLRKPLRLVTFLHLQAYAVWPSKSVEEAAQRGAGLGFVAYGVYELTNWATLKVGLRLPLHK